MKRRRNLLVALLLVCAMGIGVGYAAISGDLQITNNVEIAAQTFDVKFVKYAVTVTNETVGNQTANEIAVKVNTATAATGDLNAQTVTLDVTGMRDVNEAVQVVFTIKNNNDTTMYLGTPSVSDDTLGGMGSITCTPPANTVLNSGDETTVTVTITLTEAWTDTTAKNVDGITITINATSVAP